MQARGAERAFENSWVVEQESTESTQMRGIVRVRQGQQTKSRRCRSRGHGGTKRSNCCWSTCSRTSQARGCSGRRCSRGCGSSKCAAVFEATPCTLRQISRHRHEKVRRTQHHDTMPCIHLHALHPPKLQQHTKNRKDSSGDGTKANGTKA